VTADVIELSGRLHPQAAELLAAIRAANRPNAHLLPVDEARRRFDADAAHYPREPVAQVFDVRIPVPGGDVPSRVYRPAEGLLPGIVYFHGGGWVIGSVDSHDPLCRALANASGCLVLSVGYRLGPEFRHPTAVDDAYAATEWLVEHAGDLGVSPERIAVAGDSAGGNLAAVVSLLARNRGRPSLRAQALIYPVTTADLEVGFDDALDGLMLHREEMEWHQRNYLADPSQASSPLVSPLGSELEGVPAAVIVSAGCDPLHAQAELYVDALERAGVTVEHLAYPGQVHGFFQLPATMDDARDAIDRVAAALRRALA
jgi:acetyl esterase